MLYLSASVLAFAVDISVIKENFPNNVLIFVYDVILKVILRILGMRRVSHIIISRNGKIFSEKKNRFVHPRIVMDMDNRLSDDRSRIFEWYKQRGIIAPNQNPGLHNRPIILVIFGKDQPTKCSDSAIFNYSVSVFWGCVIHIWATNWPSTILWYNF